jgi:hypothetical protein
MTIVVLLGLFFFVSKDEIFEQFINFCYRVENKKSSKIDIIRSDQGKKFEIQNLMTFIIKDGIGMNTQLHILHNKMEL